MHFEVAIHVTDKNVCLFDQNVTLMRISNNLNYNMISGI